MSLYSLQPVITFDATRGLGDFTRMPSSMAPSYTEMQASELGSKPRSVMPSRSMEFWQIAILTAGT